MPGNVQYTKKCPFFFLQDNLFAEDKWGRWQFILAPVTTALIRFGPHYLSKMDTQTYFVFLAWKQDAKGGDDTATSTAASIPRKAKLSEKRP